MKRLPPLSLIFLLLLGLGLTWVLHSSAALRWGFSAASEHLPLTLEAASVDGSLAGPMQIRGLKIVSGNVTITARELDLDWWAGDLLRGRVNLKYLTARELLITSVQPAETEQQTPGEPTPLELPKLPVALDLKNLDIDGLSYVSNGNTVRILEGFRGAAMWNSSGIALSVDELQRTDVSLAKSWLQVEGQLPHKLSGHLEWKLPSLLSNELVGQSELGGDLGHPRTRNSLLQPTTASLDLSVDLGLAAPLVEGTLDAQRINLSALQNSWPDEFLTAHADFSTDGKSFNTQGAVQWAELPGMDIALQSIVETDHVQLLALDIRPQEIGGNIHLAGKVPLSAEHEFQLTAQWNELDLDLSGKRLLSAGTASLSGTPSAYSLEVNTDSQLDEYPAVSLQASATGSKTGLVVSSFLAKLMQGSAAGKAELDWQDGLKASAHIAAKGLNTSTLDASFPGQVPHGTVNLETGLELAVDESGNRLKLNLEKLDGDLEGEKLTGRGTLALNPEQLDLQALELHLGGGMVKASGTLSENLEFDVQVTQMEIAHWLPQLGGILSAELALSGPIKNPVLEGTISASNPHFDDWKGERIDAQLSVNLATQVASSLSLQARGLHNAQQLLGDLDVQARGVTEDHEFILKLTGGDQELLAEARGAYKADSGWSGEISRIEIISAPTSSSPWVLTDAAPLTIGAGGYRLGTLCLRQAEGRACLSANLVAGAGDVSLQATSLPLSIVNPLLGDSMDMSGLLNGELLAQFNQRGELTGHLKLELGQSNINWHRRDGDLIPLSIMTARLDGNASPQGIDIQAMLDLGDQDNIQLALNLERSPGPPTGWPARGWVSVDLADLSRYDTMFSGLEDLTGKLSSRLELTGSLDKPLTSGHLSLENMETYLPEVGTRISAVNVDLTNQNQATQLVASATIGSGDVALSGEVALLQGEPRANLRLTGDGLTLVDSQNLYLQASPDLSLTLVGNDVNITGKLHVPLARIKPIDLGSAVRSSPDAVVLDNNGGRKDRGRFKVTTNVVLELGNRVRFDGYGLAATSLDFSNSATFLERSPPAVAN